MPRPKLDLTRARVDLALTRSTHRPEIQLARVVSRPELPRVAPRRELELPGTVASMANRSSSSLTARATTDGRAPSPRSLALRPRVVELPRVVTVTPSRRPRSLTSRLLPACGTMDGAIRNYEQRTEETPVEDKKVTEEETKLTHRPFGPTCEIESQKVRCVDMSLKLLQRSVPELAFSLDPVPNKNGFGLLFRPCFCLSFFGNTAFSFGASRPSVSEQELPSRVI